MRKSYLSLFFLFCVIYVGAQTATYSYGFGGFNSLTRNPYYCNDINQDNINVCANFFPNVPVGAGSLKVNAESDAWAGIPERNLFTIVKDSQINKNLDSNVFKMRAAVTSGKANRFLIDKFGVTGSGSNLTDSASNTAMIEFRVKFNSDEPTSVGDFVFALGTNEAGFSTSSIPNVELQSNTVFMALRFNLTSSGSITTYVYQGTGWIPFPYLLPISKDKVYTFVIYANNKSTTSSSGGTNPAGSENITLNSGEWYMKINGVSPSGQAKMNQLGGVSRNSNINSFMIGGYNSPGNAYFLYFDDLRYSTNSATPAALPVSLKNFNVNYKSVSNKLTWTTSSELNNKGFEVQRAIGTTDAFKTIGFVGSRAKDGNSQIEISYSFEDADVKAGQTHYYRLNQIDFDGKSTLSPVRSVKPGSIESNLNVYPNPSQGTVTVNTGSASGKLNIYILDNTGRTVNQYMNVSTSNTRINNLKKGLYTLKIVNTETGEQTAQRVVVQ